MHIIVDGEAFYIDRIYWFHSGNYAVYEFANWEGTMHSFNVAPNEKLEDKVELFYEED